jgi:HEAT repeat protein
MRVRALPLTLIALIVTSPAVLTQRHQPTSASVLSEHHLEVLESMTPQAQAEFLLERSINRYQGANEQIHARVSGWRGKIAVNERLDNLFRLALNSDDLTVRAAAIDLDLAGLNVEKTVTSINALEANARHGEQGPRANALWRIGLLGNRGVDPERAFEILMSSVHDENVNVRYWAVEGLAYLGTQSTIAPLLSIFHDDPSPMIRERAACSLAQSGMLSAALRLTAVPHLLDFAEDPVLDAQTRSWVFQALRDITGQTLPRNGAAWRDWYVRSLRK